MVWVLLCAGICVSCLTVLELSGDNGDFAIFRFDDFGYLVFVMILWF